MTTYRGLSQTTTLACPVRSTQYNSVAEEVCWHLRACIGTSAALAWTSTYSPEGEHAWGRTPHAPGLRPQHISTPVLLQV